uniref:Uncharacterized protein n=1 Tax=viral metagenome TaxID=1070528 RepID=A0A6H1ZHE1_9ZZZZ
MNKQIFVHNGDGVVPKEELHFFTNFHNSFLVDKILTATTDSAVAEYLAESEARVRRDTAEEHPPEKIAQAEKYLAECATDFTPTMEKLRQIEAAGFHEIDVYELECGIRQLSDFPKYQFRLRRISCVSGFKGSDFKAEIDKAPPKVHKQFQSAQELGVFEDYEILKVEKIPDPILVGRFKVMYFEISRWS